MGAGARARARARMRPCGTHTSCPSALPRAAGPAPATADGADEGAQGAARTEAAEAAAEARRVALQASGACEHVAQGAAVFAHAMCRACFEDYLDVSGGIVPVRACACVVCGTHCVRVYAHARGMPQPVRALAACTPSAMP